MGFHMVRSSEVGTGLGLEVGGRRGDVPNFYYNESAHAQHNQQAEAVERLALSAYLTGQMGGSKIYSFCWGLPCKGFVSGGSGEVPQ